MRVDVAAKPNLSRASLAVLFVTLLWCVYWLVHSWHFVEDDAFIHLEFARSIANGQGFAFNGRVVDGDTAPLWVLMLVAVHTVIVNWIITAKVLSGLGVLVGFSGIYALAARISRALLRGIEARVLPALLVLLVAVSPYTCYWMFSGMESLAAGGLACWVILLATSNQPTKASFLTACLLAGIGPLVRPEMAVLAALLAIPLIGQWRRLQKDRTPLTLALGFLLFCGPFLAWSFYSWHAFGHMLPNTNAAKRASKQHVVFPHVLSAYAMGFPFLLVAALGALAFASLRPRRAWASLKAAAGSVWRSNSDLDQVAVVMWLFIFWALLATTYYIVNHTYVQSRYILLVAPGLLVLAVVATLKLSRSAGWAIYAIALLEALIISVFVTRPFLSNKGINCEAMADAAAYIRQHLPPAAPVATYSIGEIAFLSQHLIIDTGGIMRPEAVQYLNSPVEMQVRSAQAAGAEYFVGVMPQPGAVLVQHWPNRFVAWTLKPSHYAESGWIELWKLQPLH